MISKGRSGCLALSTLFVQHSRKTYIPPWSLRGVLGKILSLCLLLSPNVLPSLHFRTASEKFSYLVLVCLSCYNKISKIKAIKVTGYYSGQFWRLRKPRSRRLMIRHLMVHRYQLCAVFMRTRQFQGSLYEATKPVGKSYVAWSDTSLVNRDFKK